MQLLLVMLLLAVGGGKITDDIKPLLESVGGGDLKKVIGEAEQLAEVIGAVQAFAPAVNGPQDVQPSAGETKKGDGFPLAAVADFANEDVLCALTDYLKGQ